MCFLVMVFCRLWLCDFFIFLILIDFNFLSGLLFDMSYTFLKPFLFRMDPEEAHEKTLAWLNEAYEWGFLGFAYGQQSVPVECMGMVFDNPVGLAAGLDKDGAYIDALAALGFGFIEVGTVTPKPQVGNDKPRLFRLQESHAVINRMGFNNLGVDNLISNVKKSKYQGILGINIGKNATTPVERASDDYLYCLERVYPYASYITVNISSPNTENLRSLQGGSALLSLLSRIKNRHSQLATDYGFYVPLVIKVAPDLIGDQVEFIAQGLLDFEIDGLITTNTTISRENLVEVGAITEEKGGLSGRPLFSLSTKILDQFRDLLAGKVALIGAGGIDSGGRAVQKVVMGASLVQLYTGLVYQGPGLIQECVESIADYQDKIKDSHQTEPTTSTTTQHKGIFED